MLNTKIFKILLTRNSLIIDNLFGKFLEPEKKTASRFLKTKFNYLGA